MQEIIESSRNDIAISIIDLLIGQMLAVLLGMVVVLVYRWTHRGMHYERSFLVTLVMMPMVVAVVMMFIGSNLALSLGMVGALSIIRFRTVIKDSRDMVFLFLCIAIGLGCGTFNWVVTVIVTVAMALVMALLHLLRFGIAVHADYALVISGKQPNISDQLKGTLKEHVDFLEVRSVDIRDEGWEIVFEVRFFKDRVLSESALFGELREKYDISHISILAPQLALPL